MGIRISRIRWRIDGHGLLGTAAHLLALTGLAACTGSPPQVDGVYDAQASLGELTLPAKLELDREGGNYRGRVTIMMGEAVHFALRSYGWHDSTVEFSTSSPATSMTLTTSGDSLWGVLTLPGGRAINIAGARLADETVSVQLLGQFDLEAFAPKVLSRSSRGEAFPTLSPSGDEIYFSTYSETFTFHTTVGAQLIDGTWTAQEVSSFSGLFSDRSPSISPDGTRLLFASTRPRPGESDTRNSYDLWEVTRDTNGTWGEPRFLADVSSDASDYQPSLTEDGILYFTSKREEGLGGQDIWAARADGSVENLGPTINSEGGEISAFIAPDESYLIFATSAAHDGHVGNDDLYVSFNRDGQWTAPRNLRLPINSFANEYGAFVSRDGQYLYFTSDRHPPANLYRVEVGELLMDR